MRSQIPLFRMKGDTNTRRTFLGRPWCLPAGGREGDVDGTIMLERDNGTPFIPMHTDEIEPLTSAARELVRWANNEEEFGA